MSVSFDENYAEYESKSEDVRNAIYTYRLDRVRKQNNLVYEQIYRFKDSFFCVDVFAICIKCIDIKNLYYYMLGNVLNLQNFVG